MSKENEVLLAETLAELEHLQWMAWAKNLKEREELSPERVERWNKLMIPYSELTEEQKEQDREWVYKTLTKAREAVEKINSIDYPYGADFKRAVIKALGGE